MTTTGVRGASMIMRARVLLALDTSVGEVGSKEAIATRLGVSGETLRLVAKRFAETGGDVHATIARKKRDLPPANCRDRHTTARAWLAGTNSPPLCTTYRPRHPCWSTARERSRSPSHAVRSGSVSTASVGIPG
ncbi:hypothetical protein MOV08_35430 [Streptomyces yunnanensis]|uniref:Homeodomain-like domain-containing protein n=1 Tax=Streptomyces yunnanensis TaxID=156453 RepID=A0ABY8AGX3_9ACTN|nr:hypothetical protein [Streptomyces yunnanensis]WEB44058.1 hypothetical protein MOV08_35430 [Streptomyces yunnanensis]